MWLAIALALPSMKRTNSTKMAACVTDASNLTKRWQGCTQAPWASYAAESYGAIRPANDTEPVIVINVGANKGYNVVSFATLWSNALWQRLDPQTWQKAIWHTPMVKAMAISMAFSSGIEMARATKVQGDIGCDISR